MQPMIPNYTTYNEFDLPDTSETIEIAGLALIKMLKHARAGVPTEVMGLMLGTKVDEYKIKVVDVFAMPQTGTGVTVEAVDPIYQQEMMELLAITGRPEKVVGWYHSHPGFGCWLSNVDISTQQSFEQLDKRTVALVIDPIQSVKGKVVLDAFRSINQQQAMFGGEVRQVTSNLGFLNRPTLISLLHGLNRQYYSFNITYSKNKKETDTLLNLHQKTWADNLRLERPNNSSVRLEINEITKSYKKMLGEIKKLKEEDLEVYKIGKVDFRRHLLDRCKELEERNKKFLLVYSVHKAIFSE